MDKFAQHVHVGIERGMEKVAKRKKKKKFKFKMPRTLATARAQTIEKLKALSAAFRLKRLSGKLRGTAYLIDKLGD